MQKGVG